MSARIMLVIEGDSITDELALAMGDVLALTAHTWTGAKVKCTSVEVGTSDAVEFIAVEALIAAHTAPEHDVARTA